MGTKQLFVFATVAVALAGGVSQGLAQPSTPDAGLRVDREIVFWQSIAESDNSADFEAYLEQWPEGTFARLAEIRLEELPALSPVNLRRVPTGADHSRSERRLLNLLRREGATRQPDENGWTLLHYAAVLDLPDLVRRLLDEDGLDDWWRRSFGLSIEEATFDVGARLEDDGEPLSARLRRALRQLGLPLDAFTRDAETPLHLAAIANAGGAVSELLAGGAEVHATTPLDWTPLHYAAWSDAADAAEMLLAHDADVEVIAEAGWVPLHLAAWADSHETAAVLMEHGASIAAENDDGETPLELSRSRKMRALLSRRTRR